MMRTTPEMAHPSLNFGTTPAGGHLIHVRLQEQEARKHGGSSMESGFEPEALQIRSREDLLL
ncbi:hypothetical protein AVEN_136748-1, partial [Araneus ventricosus]